MTARQTIDKLRLMLPERERCDNPDCIRVKSLHTHRADPKPEILVCHNELTMTAECQDCDGTGSYLLIPDQDDETADVLVPCERCGGTGKIQ